MKQPAVLTAVAFADGTVLGRSGFVALGVAFASHRALAAGSIRFVLLLREPAMESGMTQPPNQEQQNQQ